MDKIKEIWGKLVEKFKSLSKGIRIALIVAVITTLIAFLCMLFYSSANKFQVLFSNLEPNDAQIVTAALKEKEVEMKIDGDTILVDKTMVDELRLELAPELSEGSHGYELMDASSSFGMTDEEFKIKKQRMLTGELERTIKSFAQIESARVHITPSKDSVFVEDKTPGKAAIYIKLNAGAKLSTQQVSSIVALASGSLPNTPAENIEVIDDKMNLLTSELNKEDGAFVGAEEIEKQYILESKYEKELEDTINKLLQPVLGKDKTSVSVKATLDFDSKKYTETVIDPNKVIVSQQTIEQSNTSGTGDNSNSTVDNNMSNSIDDEGQQSGSSSIEQSTNYESGRKESQVIAAPGEVKRLTATVFVDGNLSNDLQNAIQSAVGTAIGFNTERGDEITVIGMVFDPLLKEEKDKELENMENMFGSSGNNTLLIVIGVAILAILIAGVIIFILKKRKKTEVVEEKSMLDVVIDDKMNDVTTGIFDNEQRNEKIILEEEIKKYAQEKPEQVVDIIKSWLSENER